jgi:hypothetical protein
LPHTLGCCPVAAISGSNHSGYRALAPLASSARMVAGSPGLAGSAPQYDLG